MVFHHDPGWKSNSGFRGVFICLGQVQSIVIDMRGRHIEIAHPSRVPLHKRGQHQLALDVFEKKILPERCTLAWEEPLGQSAVDQFNETLEIDVETNLLQNDYVLVTEIKTKLIGVSCRAILFLNDLSLK